MKKVYVVTFDGYLEEYGSSIYLLGVFDSEEKAKNAITQAQVKLVKEIKGNDKYGKRAKETALHSILQNVLPFEDDKIELFKITEVDLNKTNLISYGGKWLTNCIHSDDYLGGYVE